MADRIAVMSRGRIEQVSSPTEIYDEPKTLFVNEFVGTTNVLVRRVLPQRRAQLASCSARRIRHRCSAQSRLRRRQQGRRSRSGQNNYASCPTGGLAGTVKAVMPLGAHVIYEIESPPTCRSRSASRAKAAPRMRQSGEQVRMSRLLRPDACHVFPAS